MPTYACARCGGMLLRMGFDRELKCSMCGRPPGQLPPHEEPERPPHRSAYDAEDVATDTDDRPDHAARVAASAKRRVRYGAFRRRLSTADAAAQAGISTRQGHRYNKEA